MNKYILATMLMLGLASGVAQAAIINGVHDTASPNSIESYFITALSTGPSNIFLSSQPAANPNTGNPDIDAAITGLSMNGALSVWQQVGSNWVLIGANNDGSRTPATNSVNDFVVQVHDWSASDPGAGISDPGIKALSLTAGQTYLIIQSDSFNGPTSLSNDTSQTGALGQTIALTTDKAVLQTALWGTYDPFGAPLSNVQLNSYALTITGNVAQTSAPAHVPLPAAVWLFGSALAGLGVIGRKKSEGQLAA